MPELIAFTLLGLANLINAYADAETIKAKTEPNHFMNGLLYVVTIMCIGLSLPDKWIWAVTAGMCMRQLVFDIALNLFRGRNAFYTSVYTSFYRKWPDTRYSSGSFLDKVENWVIDGCINKAKGRKWSYIHPITEGAFTFDNYLNGKIQCIIYSIIFVVSILQL